MRDVVLGEELQPQDSRTQRSQISGCQAYAHAYRSRLLVAAQIAISLTLLAAAVRVILVAGRNAAAGLRNADERPCGG